MLSKQFIVPFSEGLHANIAAELAKICQQYVSDVILIRKETEINPKSILGILSLGAVKGDEIIINIEGEDEVEAMKSLEDFFI